MLGRDESVARQQYRLQRLATKAQAILASRTSQRLWLASVKSVSAKQCKIYEHLELVPHLQVGHCHQHCHQGFRQAQYILHWKQSLMQQTRLRGVCSQAKLVMPKNTNKTDRVYWIMMRIHMLSQHHKGLQQKLPVCKHSAHKLCGPLWRCRQAGHAQNSTASPQAQDKPEKLHLLLCDHAF